MEDAEGDLADLRFTVAVLPDDPRMTLIFANECKNIREYLHNSWIL
jgi:hypothetical protein